MVTIDRPADAEYPEYYQTYTRLVPDGEILETLRRQGEETQRLLASVPADLETHRYAAGKWSVREVIGHCLDVERVFAFRALWMARGAAGEQPGMDQDSWVAQAGSDHRSLADLAAEWSGLRRDVITLLGSILPEQGLATGRASGGTFTARSFAWIIAGHELHHRRGLIERYGLGNSDGPVGPG